MWPGIEEVASQPKFGLHIVRAQICQSQPTVPAARERQLVASQVIELAVQAVFTAWAQPLRHAASIARLWPQIQLDRQFYVVDAIGITQQQVQFAQGPPSQTDRQIAGQQQNTGGRLQRELPEAFVIQPQAAYGTLGQPLLEGDGLLVEAVQPVGQPAGLPGPAAAGQRVSLRPGGIR